MLNVSAYIAQGLEHWSCKPGVVSSNLIEGRIFGVVKTILNITVTCGYETEMISASVAKWLRCWISHPISQ